MPTSDMRSTMDSRQFTLCPVFAAFASSIAATSTVGMVAASVYGTAAGGAAGAENALLATMTAEGGPAGVAGVASWWPKMLSFSLLKMPMGYLSLHGRQGTVVVADS